MENFLKPNAYDWPAVAAALEAAGVRNRKGRPYTRLETARIYQGHYPQRAVREKIVEIINGQQPAAEPQP